MNASPPIYMAQEPQSQKIIKQKYRGSGVFFVFVFLQEHGVGEEVTHMLVRGKQKNSHHGRCFSSFFVFFHS